MPTLLCFACSVPERTVNASTDHCVWSDLISLDYVYP